MSERPTSEQSPEPAPAVPAATPPAVSAVPAVPAVPAVAAVPTLRIVRGAPTPEEVAVLAAVVNAAAVAAACGDSAAGADELPRGRWNDPLWGHRRPLLPGPGGWRASAH